MGETGAAPDVPSGVQTSVPRLTRLHNKEPRYFIPASGRLEVVSLERADRYNRLNVEQWKDLLDASQFNEHETRQILYQKQVSEIPWVNAGRCFHAKLRRRTFPWGKAILFLTSYVQGSTGGPVNNDMLVLVVQGITNDGLYAVNAHFEIRHERLPDSSWDERTKGKAVFDIDHEDAQAEKWLDAQPDSAFNPTFQQYETFLGSLQIIAPSRRIF